jgi:hypothetical protein
MFTRLLILYSIFFVSLAVSCAAKRKDRDTPAETQNAPSSANASPNSNASPSTSPNAGVSPSASPNANGNGNDIDFDLVVIAGQSNATGWMSEGKNYQPATASQDDYIPFFWTFESENTSSNGWVHLSPQKGRFPSGHFGPEVSFARNYRAKHENVAIFKYTKGASSICKDWLLPGRQGGIYDRMKNQLNAQVPKLNLWLSQAQTDSPQRKYKAKLKAFIWIQGESDGDKCYGQYETNLNRIIYDFRMDIAHNPELPVILSVDELHPFTVAGKPGHKVVDAQKDLAKVLSKVRFSSFSDTSRFQKADVTHLTSKGVDMQGQQLFQDLEILTQPK